MLCPNCGADVGTEMRLCPRCHSKASAADPSQKPSSTSNRMRANTPNQDQKPVAATDSELDQHQQDETLEHDDSSSMIAQMAVKRKKAKQAGLFLRACAWYFDFMLILSFYAAAMILISVMVGGKYFASLYEVLPLLNNLPVSEMNRLLLRYLGTSLPLTLAIVLVIPVCYYAIAALYYMFLESSNTRGTFGKAIVGIQVVGQDGKAITTGTAAIRFFARFISCISLGLGFLISLITDYNQGLHDILTGCFVEKKETQSYRRYIFGALGALIFGSLIPILPFAAILPLIDSKVMVMLTSMKQNASSTLDSTVSSLTPQEQEFSLASTGDHEPPTIQLNPGDSKVIEEDRKSFKAAQQAYELQQRNSSASPYGLLQVGERAYTFIADNVEYDSVNSRLTIKLFEERSGTMEHTASIVLQLVEGAKFVSQDGIQSCDIVSTDSTDFYGRIRCDASGRTHSFISQFYTAGRIENGGTIEMEMVGERVFDEESKKAVRWNLLFSSQIHHLTEGGQETMEPTTQDDSKPAESASSIKGDITREAEIMRARELEREKEENEKRALLSGGADGVAQVGDVVAHLVDSVAIYRPSYRRLDVGFFKSKLSTDERRMFSERASLFTTVNNKAPNLILSISYNSRAIGNEKSTVDIYTIYVIRDPRGSFYFPGISDKRVFRRTSKDTTTNELSELSGAFRIGSTLEGKLRGEETFDKTKYKWDVSFKATYAEVK